MVDHHSEGLFDIPIHVLSSRSGYFERFFQTPSFRKHRLSEESTTRVRFTFPKFNLCDFYDFVRWLETGRILHVSHSNATYAADHSARKLVNALALGFKLESEQYQQAAMRELYGLGHILIKPESLVDDIFAITSTTSMYSARRLIVAIVATRTGGSQRPRGTVAGKQDPRQEHITATAFWVMYDGYCRARKNDLRYPGSFEDAIA